MGRLAVQANNHIDTKQEKQWVIRPTHETYLDQLVGHPVGPPPSEAALPVVCQPCGPSAHGLSAHGPSAHGLSARSSSSSIVVPSSPARLEHARSNPLTPGTLVHPPRYPDQPEPIKLNYNKL